MASTRRLAALERVKEAAEELLKRLAQTPCRPCKNGKGPSEDCLCCYEEDALRNALRLADDCLPKPDPSVCGADDHPVFVYPCTLPKGHEGPHDNGSGDPWFSVLSAAPPKESP